MIYINWCLRYSDIYLLIAFSVISWNWRYDVLNCMDEKLENGFHLTFFLTLKLIFNTYIKQFIIRLIGQQSVGLVAFWFFNKVSSWLVLDLPVIESQLGVGILHIYLFQCSGSCKSWGATTIILLSLLFKYLFTTSELDAEDYSSDAHIILMTNSPRSHKSGGSCCRTKQIWRFN